MKYISDRQTTRHIEQLVEGLAALSALKSGNWSASVLWAVKMPMKVLPEFIVPYVKYESQLFFGRCTFRLIE